MMMVKMLKMGSESSPLNSNIIEKQCEEFKEALLDDDQALSLFRRAADIFKSSGIDLSKRQYKSESETDILKKAVEVHIQANAADAKSRAAE